MRKLTYEYVKNYFDEQGCELIEKEYVGSKIKTWEELEKEYGIDKGGNINSINDCIFSKEDEEEIGKNFPDRVY